MSTRSDTIAAAILAVCLSASMPASDATLLESMAARLAPRERVRPSEWAEQNVTLSSEQTERPGAFRCDYLPFTRALHDRLWEHPEKRGEIWIKPAQIGASRVQFNKVACDADTDPGRSLYIAESDPKVKKFASEELLPTLRKVGGGRVGDAIEREAAQGRRLIMLSIPLPGGQIDLASAGTESSTVGVAYRRVYIDEFEMSTKALPKGAGDLWQSARKRTTTYRFTGRESCFGHPRLMDAGIHEKWCNLSDMGSWGFDCPHAECGGFVAPRWRMVRYRLIRESDGRPDPSSAWLSCPHCGREITNEQRARALWPGLGETGGRDGGSGRVESELSAEEAARREYIGIWITGLCVPHRTVESLARAKDEAERSGREQAIMDWWNKDEGEPFQQLGNTDITEESLRACDLTLEGEVLPEDIEFVTVGGDVQAPKDSPSLYICAKAWARSGLQYAVGYWRITGHSTFAAYHSLLQSKRWRTRDGRELGVLADCLDCGYATDQVMDQGRVPLYSPGGAMIRRMVVKYEPKMAADLAMRMAPDGKRLKPGRPDLGPIDYRYLHRNTWVDREIQAIIQKRLKVCCARPEGWLAHMTANVLRPVQTLHGQEPDRMEWAKPKEYRDDWLQSGAYATVAAVAHGELETIHLRGSAVGQVQTFTFGGTNQDRGERW